MKIPATGARNLLRIIVRRVLPIFPLICLLVLTTAPMSAGPKQSIPPRYSLSFVAQQSTGNVVIQQSVDVASRNQTTFIRQADQSVHQFDFSYNEQGATLSVFLQRRPVLTVNFPASPNGAPQFTWLNGMTPDSLHETLFRDVQLLSQVRADGLSAVGIPIEAAYILAFETSDAIYGSAPNRFIRTTITPDSTLAVDPLVVFCAGYAANIFQNCLIQQKFDPSICTFAGFASYVDCLLTLS